MFTNTSKDLGTIKVGSENEILFNFTDDIVITKIDTPCDCTTAYVNPISKFIKVIYKPNPIPKHLKNSYLTEKIFTISYSDKDMKMIGDTTLSFIAKVVE